MLVLIGAVVSSLEPLRSWFVDTALWQTMRSTGDATTPLMLANLGAGMALHMKSTRNDAESTSSSVNYTGRLSQKLVIAVSDHFAPARSTLEIEHKKIVPTGGAWASSGLANGDGGSACHCRAGRFNSCDGAVAFALSSDARRYSVGDVSGCNVTDASRHGERSYHVTVAFCPEHCSDSTIYGESRNCSLSHKAVLTLRWLQQSC